MRGIILRHGREGTRANVRGRDFAGLMGRGRNVEADDDAFEFRLGRGITPHDERVVAGDNVPGRIGQAVKKVEAFEHLRDIVNDRKRAALFEIVVEMRGVGGQDDPSAARPDAGALQAGGMAAEAVHGEAGREFIIAVVEDGSFRIDVTDHLQDVFEVERRAEFAMGHQAAGGEGHFAILKMKAGDGKAVEIAGVVVVEMRDDYFGDAIGIDADEAQGIDGMAKPFALAADGRFIGEAGVEDKGGIGATCDPDEVVEVGGGFVRIGGDEIVLRMAIAEVAIANGKQFEWFDGHASLTLAGVSASGIG